MGSKVLDDGVTAIVGLVAAQKVGLDVETVEVVDLIVDECDERGDHDRDTIGAKTGQLVAKTLSTTSGHEHKAVALGHGGVDDVKLVFAKGLEVESVAKGLIDALGPRKVCTSPFGGELKVVGVLQDLECAEILSEWRRATVG